MLEHVAKQDPELHKILNSELGRLRSKINLIASENLPSVAVLETLGTWLTTKYAEGYPGRRYYGGCDYVDEAEDLARERAKDLFGADHANVQPHAGAQANMAVFFAFMEPGDTFVGMNLAHGGHLTHGSPVNFSGRLYNVAPYGVSKDDELIDYDEVLSVAKQARPKVIVAGSTAYPRNIDWARFRQIADEVGAILWVDAAHFIGLVAGKVVPSPVEYADVVTFTTHKTLRGPRGGVILCKSQHAKLIDSAVFPRMQGGPLMHVIAAKAVCFKEAAEPEFATYAQHVVDNARVLGETLIEEGLRLVSGGTDTHLLLAEVSPLDGAECERRLAEASIIVNKNQIPFDSRPPAKGSGIRVGTPIVTTTGMGAEEMRQIGSIIGRVLRDDSRDDALATASWARGQVAELTERFVVYPELEANV